VLYSGLFLWAQLFHYMNIKITIWLNLATLFLSLYSVSFATNAAENAAENVTGPNFPEHLLRDAGKNALWKNKEWLNLLHYKGDGDSYLSQVDDPRFFNAPKGKTNPQSELIASLKSFYSTDLSEPNNHPQCRFIARLHWLQKQLPDSLTQLPTVNCPQYNDWRKQVPGHKASLIFPAYHLNSPSSMFGHTLLRIDPADDAANSSWLSMAVNFGANIQASDNSIAFAIKGLAGGYSGTFIVTPYFKKIKEYNREENRDIWEYPLNLTPAETEQMVQHLWELKDINFDYYFFDENCSYRLLELLEVARSSLNLTNQFGLSAIPIDTVRSIDQAGLVTGTLYRPSQATNINHLLKQLNDIQKDLVLRIASDTNLINSAEFKQIDPAKQSIMLDAAYRYLRFQQNDDGRTDANAKNSFSLLQAINKVPNFKSPEAGYSAHQKPEKGHLSKRLDIIAGNNRIKNKSTAEDANREYAQLQFRMSFHSLDDNIDGFLEGAQINIGSISARAYKDEVQLQQLDFIDIFSLSPRNAFFQPLSWRVYTGLEQQFINGREHLTGHVTGGAGVAYEPWSRGYFYALATTRFESNSQFSRALEPALGYSSGLLQHFSFGTTQLEFSGEAFLNNEIRQRVKFIHNFPLARNHSLQFLLNFQRQRNSHNNQTPSESHYETSDAQLSYRYFYH